MKTIIAIMLTAASLSASADNYVNGYYRNNGTYVQPHYQTAPDRNPYNNYSTQGNYNPYTGQQGTQNPYQVQQQYAPQQPQYQTPYGQIPNMYQQQNRRNGW